MVGYRKKPTAGADEGVVFLVLPEGWKEINPGCDFKKAAKLAVVAGWIIKVAPNKTQALVRLPGMDNKPSRVYVLGHQVLADVSDGTENE
ncbi:hypothetical protein [Aeromonas sp. s5]|uniref:hypothetical protein n=1 Tax=Aeromonas sp. s5 TaxID=3138487 RepID=UPI0034A1FAFD